MRITIPLVAPDKNAGRLRVAVVPRLVPAFSFGLAAAGAGISALLLRQVLLAMEEAGDPGIGAVAQAMWEAHRPVLVGLFLAIIVGAAGLLVLVIRMFVETKTASPSVWFLLLTGTLGLLPVALLWWAERLFIGALYPGGGDIITVAENLMLWLLAIAIGAIFVLLLLLAISVWPVSSLTKPTWGPVAVLLLMEVALMVLAVAFWMRASWLVEVSLAGRLLP